MKISKGDFDDYVIKEVIASARNTQLITSTDVIKGEVSYRVKTQLELNPFHDINDSNAYHFSHLDQKFSNIEDAIKTFNIIQEYAEKDVLVRVVGV